MVRGLEPLKAAKRVYPLPCRKIGITPLAGNYHREPSRNKPLLRVLADHGMGR
jgi:hypothetical protein